MNDNTTTSLPRLNEPAPQFQATTTTGRNVDEIIRVVDALQLNTEKGLATPANWKPGDKCIIPAPLTKDGAEKRMKEPGAELKDWYLAFKQI